ncbi:hypothetical protein ACFE04_027743 [Oxalis oulophora]
MEDGDEEPDRADSWMWARMNPAGGFDDPDIQLIADEILRLKARQKSGELVLGDNEDILSLATGIPIKASKIQACGFNATKTMLVPSKRMTAPSVELIRLRRIVKQFEDGERAKDGKKFTPKKNDDAEEALAASQKKVAELEKKLADFYKSQEPYIPEKVNVDDHKNSAQDDESTDSEGELGKPDKFANDQTDLSYFFNPPESKFPDSIPGKFTRGPYYPNQYLDTELMDDIFNEKKAPFEEKECTLWAVIDGGKEKVAGGRIVADGALCLSMRLSKITSDTTYNINVLGNIEQMTKELGTEKGNAAATKSSSSDKTTARIAMHMGGDRDPVGYFSASVSSI